jgi:hypothetical protein
VAPRTRARTRIRAHSLAIAIASGLALGCVGSVPGDDGDPGPGGGPDAGLADPDAAIDPEPAELRGVWITRFAYSSQAGLEAIIDRAAAANFNAVFVQVRGNGDAYYRSAHEPWARNLTGVLGRDPGWDPLQVAIDRARLHGMELHAYVNALSGWITSQAPVPAAEGPVQHPLYLHPEWVAVDSTGVNRDSEYLYFSPGIPAVRAHIAAVVEDLLEKYDVDGVHLDRIRAPGSDYSRDPVTLAAFEAARAADPDLSWGDFMREQVNLVVDAIQGAIDRVRPRVRHSAAVWGIYRPLSGCATSEGYGQYYQDSLAWAARGSMDALVPMIYWKVDPGACTDFRSLLDVFVGGATGRQVWGGMHALDGGAFSFAEVEARIEHARAAGAEGVVVFASSHLDADPGRWAAFPGTDAEPGPFHEPIGTPDMPWKP